jgi:hypothetical protein
MKALRGWRGRILVAVTAVLALSVPVVLPNLLSQASAAAKTVWIPARWTQTGEVPWVQSRTKESANFVLLWGEKSGTDPRNASGDARFDPDNIVAQLENLYDFYVNKMKFTPETGLLAEHKIIVIVTRTWNRTALDAWATGGSTDNRVGVINIAPGAAAPGSWGLAHELAHVFCNYTFLGRSGAGLTHPSAGTFWEASAEFMAMQVYPKTAAGDLTRFLRTENLAYSSSRHHYGAWMLLQYIKDRDGLAMFNRIWNEARNTEHPLEVYRRITGISQAELNRRVGEYAQHNVTWDYSNRADFMPFINSVYGAGFLNAYKGVPVEAVNASARHYKIDTGYAPSDYGYNKVQLVPDSDGALIRLHLKGHAETGASGWTYGFVAVRNGTPRYGPVSQVTDGEISFQTQPGERDVFLVVTGTPTAVPKYGFLDGWPKNRRYSYEFRLSGAIPSGHEPGYTKPAATNGGHWHSNGGGWVAGNANVSASAYVGPRAAVYSGSVTGNARIEDLAWVNGGNISGNAVVRHSAIVQGGATISGNAVIGGDAEPPGGPTGGNCTQGTYLMFNPDRACNGGGGEADINPAHGTFPTDQLAITGTTPTPTTPVPTTPVPTTPVPTTPAPTTPAPTTPAPGIGGCTAAFAVTGQWQGGFQAEVNVTAGSASIKGWTVGWTFGSGQSIGQSWNATVSANGSTVTAANASWNGSLDAGGGAAFGLIGSGSATPVPTVTCTAR